MIDIKIKNNHEKYIKYIKPKKIKSSVPPLFNMTDSTIFTIYIYNIIHEKIELLVTKNP